MQAAELLLHTRRVDEVTLDEIARQADVGKGTIYLYFADKEDLIFQAAMAGFEEMCACLRSDAAQPGALRERLLQLCGTITSFFEARRALFRIILSEGQRAVEQGGSGLWQRWRDRRKAMTEAVQILLDQGRTAGEIRADMSAEILAEYLLGMLRTRAWEFEDRPEEESSLASLVELFLKGSASLPGATQT